MKPRYEHLVWDFDGTLYDTYPIISGAMEQTLKDLSLVHPFSSEQIMALVKKSTYHATCQISQSIGCDQETLWKTYRANHQRMSAMEFVPFAGMMEGLKRLHDLGCKHYLYTHRDKRAVEQLQKDGLLLLFSDCITHDDGFADKPAPDALLALMARNHLAKSDTIMIGDRDVDLLAGQNAGIDGLLFDPQGYYADFQATYHATSMSQMIDCLAKERDV